MPSICLGSLSNASHESAPSPCAFSFRIESRQATTVVGRDESRRAWRVEFSRSEENFRARRKISREREGEGKWSFPEEKFRAGMALTPTRCRGENLSEETTNEDEVGNGGNFEPLSDSCGESDMEGLDLSLFEPQVDTTSWCDSRIHAGTLHILVHYCGKLWYFSHGSYFPSFADRAIIEMYKLVSLSGWYINQW